MMDLMRNRANFALTDSVYKSRSIAQGQESERKSSNFRLVDHPGVERLPFYTAASGESWLLLRVLI